MQLQKELMPDGSSIDFKLCDALHYHVYDMEPLLAFSHCNYKRIPELIFTTHQATRTASIKRWVWWLCTITAARIY
jgi:hypothetical protein